MSKVNNSRDWVTKQLKEHLPYTELQKHPSSLTLEIPLVPRGTSPSLRSLRHSPATPSSKEKVAGEDRRV